MAKIVSDVGPAAAQALTVAPAAVNNISLTIIDRGGAVKIGGAMVINNPAASTPTVTGAIRKNGVQVASTVRTMVMNASSRSHMNVDHLDLAAAVGDVYTLEIATSAAVANHQLEANQSALTIEAVSPDGALCAGVGAATA